MKGWRKVLIFIIIYFGGVGFHQSYSAPSSTRLVVPNPSVHVNSPVSAAVSSSAPGVKSRGGGSETKLIAAIKAIGSNQRTLVVPPGTHSIVNNLTIPTNINLRVEKGSILAIASGVTLTINGSLEAGPYQIFRCIGTGNVSFGPGSIKEAYFRWWGAKGDGGTDDTAAIQAAFNAFSGKSGVLKGCYMDNYRVETITYSSGSVNIGYNLTLDGQGAQLIQASSHDLLRIEGKGINLKLTLKNWGLQGRLKWVWFIDLPSEPREVRKGSSWADGAGQAKQAHLTDLSAAQRCYWDGHAKRLYVYSAAAGARPNDFWADGTRLNDTKFVKYFSGKGLTLTSGTHGRNPTGMPMPIIENVNIQGFDYGLYVIYCLVAEYRDLWINLTNTAIYGTGLAGGKSHGNSFRNLKITNNFGKSAIDWNSARQFIIDKGVIEFISGRIATFTGCGDITLRDVETEVIGWGKTHMEAICFDASWAIKIINGKWQGAAPASDNIYGYLRFIHGCSGVEVRSEFGQGGAYIYTSDGTLKNALIRPTAMSGGSTMVVSGDFTPTARIDGVGNSTAYVALTMPAGLVGKREARGASEYSKYYSGTYWIPPTGALSRNADAVLDHTTGYTPGGSSLKLTWRGANPVIFFNDAFTYLNSGTYYGVFSCYYRSDTQQTIRVFINNSEQVITPIPIAGDGVWRYLQIITGPKDMSGSKADGFKVTGVSASRGSVWLSNISMRWFATQSVASEFAGYEALDYGGTRSLPPGPKPLIDSQVTGVLTYKTVNTASTSIMSLLGATEGQQVTLSLADTHTSVPRYIYPPGGIGVYIYAYHNHGGFQPTNYATAAIWDYFRGPGVQENDAIYWGFSDCRFGGLRLQVAKPCNHQATFSWEYWNGSGWAHLAVTDPSPFSRVGVHFVEFIPPDDWKLHVAGPAAGVKAYWVRCRLSGVSAKSAGGANAGSPVNLSFFRLTNGKFGPLPQLSQTGVLQLAYNHGLWHEVGRVSSWLDGTIDWAPGSLAHGDSVTSAGIAISGASVDDRVEVFPPHYYQGIICKGFVAGPNLVKIRLQNESGSGKNLASGAWRVRVFKNPYK